MTRHAFGGDASVVDSAGNALRGTTGTVWDSEVAGIQLIDLLDAQSRAQTTITTDDNAKYHFFGPDAVTQVWVDFGSGRFLVSSTDIAARLTNLEAIALTSNLVGAPNGIPQLDAGGTLSSSYENPDTLARIATLESQISDALSRIAILEAVPDLHVQATAPSHGAPGQDAWVDSS